MKSFVELLVSYSDHMMRVAGERNLGLEER